MRIAVALSGGMDSAAAALALLKGGHEVVGFFMLLHDESGSSLSKAKNIARRLKIPLYEPDLRNEFRKLVIEPFIEQYLKGLTPSPCPICNRELKTTLLMEQVRKLGCELLATGHYAQLIRSDEREFALLRGVDPKKDQSYFLFNIKKEDLSRLLFPNGAFTKIEIWKFLLDNGFRFDITKESQELCFVKNNSYREYLAAHGIEDKPGPIQDMEGRLMGIHKGVFNFTIGQRRGIGVCGSKPYYIIKILPETNAVVIGSKEATLTNSFVVVSLNWLVADPPRLGDTYLAKIRSTAGFAECRITAIGDDTVQARFCKPQSSVAPGQAAVFYCGDRVIGGGWIT